MDSGMASLRRADDPGSVRCGRCGGGGSMAGVVAPDRGSRAVFAAGAVTLALIVIAQGWLQGTLLQYVRYP